MHWSNYSYQNNPIFVDGVKGSAGDSAERGYVET